MQWGRQIGLGLVLVLSAPTAARAQFHSTVSANPTLSVADSQTETDATIVSLTPFSVVSSIAPASVAEPSTGEDQEVPVTSGLLRRLAALLYDAFLVAAIWMTMVIWRWRRRMR